MPILPPPKPSDDGLLIDQPVYQVTPSTGTVHSVPCIRNTTRNPLPWPEFYDKRDKACSKCLPSGLPEVIEDRRDSWVVAFAISYARKHLGTS
jgi:hypothetical protein